MFQVALVDSKLLMDPSLLQNQSELMDSKITGHLSGIHRTCSTVMFREHDLRKEKWREGNGNDSNN